MLRYHVNVRVREAVSSDAAELAAVFAASWRLAYEGIIPALRLEALIRRRDTAWWQDAIGSREGTLVLEVGKRVGGYVTYGRRRGAGRQEGEIYELYLEPTFQGIGLGELLFEAARNRLDNRRLNGLIVWALSGNEAACDFYRRRGGRIVGRANDRMTGVSLPKVAFAWE